MLSCIARKYPNVLKLLINYGANVNAKDENGNTTLMWTAEENTETSSC